MFIVNQETVKTLFNYSDGKLFWKIKPCFRVKRGQEAGTLGNDNYEHIGIFGKVYMLHRIIYLYHHGYFPKYIDHINGNTLDNRIENLRKVTVTENQYNSKKRKDNTSGIKGVSWYKRDSKWRAQIKVNGKNIHLGTYTDIVEAENIIKKYREQHHGEHHNHG